MSEATFTVVVWEEGDAAVRAIGPSSSGLDARSLLRATRAKAREQHAHAEIVPWDLSSSSPATVTAYLSEQY